MRLRLPFLIVLTGFLAVSYIWGFNFFRSPYQVFLQYERAMIDYANQIRLQQDSGLEAGLSEDEIVSLRKVAIVELEGDMRNLIFDFHKYWSIIEKYYLQYAQSSGVWFTEGLSGSIYTQDDPEYDTFLALYGLKGDPESYCLIFVPEVSEESAFREFRGARIYFLQKTIWGYKIEWSRSLIDLILDVDSSSVSV